ncbi:MAG: hypothetical protein FWJ90_02215 [Actinomadura sp.]
MATWAAEPATLPDAVRYTVTAGGGPTDRWRVPVAPPPAPEEGPGAAPARCST